MIVQAYRSSVFQSLEVVWNPTAIRLLLLARLTNLSVIIHCTCPRESGQELLLKVL
jgi:hypothetical protein